MEDYFSAEQGQTVTVSQASELHSNLITEEPSQLNHSESNAPSQFTNVATNQSDFTYNDDDFAPPQEDEVTKRIRQQQEKIQEILRVKASEEYQLKQKRIQEGRKKLEQFNQSKDKERQLRKAQNIEAESRLKEQMKKLDINQGWSKVAASVKTKQGEHSGKKDISRMRQAILHKKQDQLGK